jgi:hypothetical protein
MPAMWHTRVLPVTTNAHVTRTQRNRPRRFAFHYHCAGPLPLRKPWLVARLHARHEYSRVRSEQQHGSSLLQPATMKNGSAISPKHAHGQVIMMKSPRPGHQILARCLRRLARSKERWKLAAIHPRGAIPGSSCSSKSA